MDPTTLALTILYFFSSSVMLLVNKVAFSAIPAPALVTTMQYATTVVAVVALNRCSLVDCDLSISLATLKTYWLVPFFFSLAIFTNGKLLELANVETFLVFRFATPLTVGIFDFFMLGKELPSLRSMICFVSIVVGAVGYAMADQGFALESYFWAFSYLAIITAEMILVKHVFDVAKMSNWTRVYLNNLLSIAFQPFFIVATREDLKYPSLDFNVENIAIVIASSLVGLSLAYSGTALRALISSTSFTLVGVVCKVVTIIANVLMWDRHANNLGLFFLAICLLASTLYQPSGQRTEGDWSSRVWVGVDTVCCGFCSLVDLRARPSPSSAATNPSAQQQDSETAPLKPAVVENA